MALSFLERGPQNAKCPVASVGRGGSGGGGRGGAGIFYGRVLLKKRAMDWRGEGKRDGGREK